MAITQIVIKKKKILWTCYWGKCNSAEWGHKGRFTSVKERRENLNSIWEVIREREDVQGRRNSLNKDLQQERKMEWWGKRTLRFHVRGLTSVACLFLSTEPIKRCGGSRQMEWHKRTECYSQKSALHKETDEQGMNSLLHPKVKESVFR